MYSLNKKGRVMGEVGRDIPKVVEGKQEPAPKADDGGVKAEADLLKQLPVKPKGAEELQDTKVIKDEGSKC